MSLAASSRSNGESAAVGPRNRTFAIFLISVAGLFLELMLIRWIGTEIRIFAYLQNTILIVCFFGLGMGCFTCRKPTQIRHALVSLLILTSILAIPFTRALATRISEYLSLFHGFLIWYQGGESASPVLTALKAATGLLMTFVLMVLLWEVFLPIGRLLGRFMDDHPRTIVAYSSNVFGSLVGIGLFVMMSALYMSPVCWFFAGAVMLLWFLGSGRQLALNFGILAVTILAAWFASREPEALETIWSPYQKLVVSKIDEQEQLRAGKYLITVNNVGYQGIIDLSHDAVRDNPRITQQRAGLSQYDIPFLLHPSPQRVLTVGAGAGNDPSGALRANAQHVTAVEIDPAIIEIGRRYHPERPYDSPRVKVVNDDARSFFATTNEKFDVVLFGLLDSHTTTAMTNARLDHYVYTRESITRARSLLADGGVMALSFQAQTTYIADRMARCLRDIFGEPPIVFRVPHDASGWGGVMFLTGDLTGIRQRLAANPALAQLVRRWQEDAPVELEYATCVTTDDWPYVYLENRRIPALFGILALLMVALTCYCRRRLNVPRLFGKWQRSHWHFFFLGAAFLLLEVQNISKAAVVLGNTWLVNAVIISGILCMILLANLVAAKFRRLPQGPIMFCLIGSCLVLYCVDLSSFAFLPYLTKALLVGGLTTLPMLFSGIIFIRSFALTDRKDLALGANLMGSLVGGLLQSVTFIFGIKALLLIVAGLYLAALRTRPQSISSTAFEADTEIDRQLPEPASWLDQSEQWDGFDERDLVLAGNTLDDN